MSGRGAKHKRMCERRETGLSRLLCPLIEAPYPCSLAAWPLAALRNTVGARLQLAVHSPRSRPPKGPARPQIGIRLETGSALRPPVTWNGCARLTARSDALRRPAFCLLCLFLRKTQKIVRASVSGSEPRSLARPPSERSEGGGPSRSEAKGALGAMKGLANAMAIFAPRGSLPHRGQRPHAPKGAFSWGFRGESPCRLVRAKRRRSQCSIREQSERSVLSTGGNTE